ncbi:hypothetical protein [Algoriphagus zhangzhouensis]|uniref:Uncharacterized protein n=1 Tax=Algoriphagus zhangzhouensis TaxID=1073327 RepID=A0A1M7Z781_9BACT|nr:hypothetical protein [Algoriphagus zhangzhouensis]TDY49311.1 hypothetical protein A8938_1003 [Algoriphagus zhangzhouensis]SHO60751.1 hypothetical protein SAMN04488108_1003 [Algoriphagus zhangzhouensis]
MNTSSLAYDYLTREAESLQVRLIQHKPFIMTMPMVKGAEVSSSAMQKVSHLLQSSKSKLFKGINLFLENLKRAKKENKAPENLQKDLVILKLRFNSILDQMDIFADVLSQRSEHETGIWLSGLDALSEDGLKVGQPYFDETPDLMVFLERGHGAAIRRARTRLPGGDQNPVAVIQIPRERLVGNGIAASIIHEVGHQGAELLGITQSLRSELQKMQTLQPQNSEYWKYYERWISEILADYWAMCHLGISATTGLMGVVSLPKYFQFRLDLDDPHPAPYMRVFISCAFGRWLFPNQAWNILWSFWERFYPLDGLPEKKVELVQNLQAMIPEFIKLVHLHKPKALKGKSLGELFPIRDRQPAKLNQKFLEWKSNTKLIQTAPPTLVFSVFGQARFLGKISPKEESKIFTQQLRNWAFKRH